jgi:hypothetical protein
MFSVNWKQSWLESSSQARLIQTKAYAGASFYLAFGLGKFLPPT